METQIGSVLFTTYFQNLKKGQQPQGKYIAGQPPGGHPTSIRDGLHAGYLNGPDS